MLVTVASYTNPVEAHIARGRLEAEGIEAFVAHEHHIWANWFLSTALGGVKLQVAPAATRRAMEILADEAHGHYRELLADGLLEDKFQATPSPQCPACHSTNLRTLRASERLSLVVVWLVSLPLPYTRGLLQCNNCQHVWVSRQAQAYPVLTRLFIILLLSGGFILLIRALYYLCRINDINPLCR